MVLYVEELLELSVNLCQVNVYILIIYPGGGKNTQDIWLMGWNGMVKRLYIYKLWLNLVPKYIDSNFINSFPASSVWCLLYLCRKKWNEKFGRKITSYSKSKIIKLRVGEREFNSSKRKKLHLFKLHQQQQEWQRTRIPFELNNPPPHYSDYYLYRMCRPHFDGMEIVMKTRNERLSPCNTKKSDSVLILQTWRKKESGTSQLWRR